MKTRIKCAPLIAIAVFSLALSSAVGAQQARSAPIPKCGGLVGQVLKCTQFGFTYKVPFGWVDRTAQTQQDAPVEETTPQAAPRERAGEPAQAANGRVLLSVFEHPPEVGGSGLDPAVVIAVEQATEYPKLKTAADYFGPLADIAEQRGLKMEDGPYAFAVGAKRLVRGDFVGGSDNAPVRQSSLVLLEKGYIVSFTFLAGSDGQIEDLMTNLTFTTGIRQKSTAK